MSWLSPASRRSSARARRQRDVDAGALLEHAERARLEPAARRSARERLFAEPLAVGRVEEDEIEGLDRARRPERGRVAAQDAGDAGQAERLDVGADQAASLDARLDEERMRRAARDRFEPERAGAGEKVEHARLGLGRPCACARMLKSDSRRRSLVGRMAPGQ